MNLWRKCWNIFPCWFSTTDNSLLAVSVKWTFPPPKPTTWAKSGQLRWLVHLGLPTFSYKNAFVIHIRNHLFVTKLVTARCWSLSFLIYVYQTLRIWPLWNHPDLTVGQITHTVYEWWFLCLVISVPHEIAVKWYEMIQTGLPMCVLSSFVAPVRLTSRYVTIQSSFCCCFYFNVFLLTVLLSANLVFQNYIQLRLISWKQISAFTKMQATK